MPIKLSPTLAVNKNLVRKLPIFLTIIIIFTIVTLGYLIAINPLQGKLQCIQKQISSSQIQLSSQVYLHRQLIELKTQYKELNDEYLSYHVKNSNNIEFTAFLKELFAIANKSHIEIIELIPTNTKNNGEESTQLVNMELSGEYQQIAQFINSFTQLKLATYIQALTMQKNPNDGLDNKLITKLSLLVYDFHYKMHKQKITINYDPFSYNTTINSSDLSKWSSSDLRLIGVLTQHNQNIGIVKDPDEVIHYLTTNDTLGINHTKISEITANAIISVDPSENIYREN